jgi:uncharacterized protein YjbI with pentapeptide repeats
MRVVKPIKLAALTRVVERLRRLEFHVTAMLGFPLESPRALLDEIRFWPAVMSALGDGAVLDEGAAKERGEVLVAGAFHAPGGKPTNASFVRVKVGAVDKRLSVIGDREWRDGVPTEPVPFTTMPIDWAHAFGGNGFERNPLGKGAAEVECGGKFVVPLPNVEPYGTLLRSPKDRPEPQGFLPLGLHLPQRRERAGTYDQRWLETDFPGLASDHDPTFFNVGLPDQWSEGTFVGDEPFLVENMHPSHPRLEGKLPGLVTRAFVDQVSAEGHRFVEVGMRCDTVWILPSIGIGVVVFHGLTRVQEDDAGDVANVVLACEEPGSPREVAHYREVLRRRLEETQSATAMVNDSALMPPLESGVAPNLDETDVGRWAKNQKFLEKNMHRGELRRHEENRARLLAEGLDPADFGVGAPPAADFDVADCPEEIARRSEAQLLEAKEIEGRLAKDKADLEARARAEFEEMGRDYDAEMELAQREAAGPPRMSAASHVAAMRATVAEAKARGIAMPELEAQLADPGYEAELLAQEGSAREMYRLHAHLRIAPLPLEPGEADAARVLVQAAVDTNESLAGRNLTGTRLAGMVLKGLDLAGAWLEGADLSGCDLSSANLAGAVLARADLRDCNFRGANLAGANLGAAQFHGARFDDANLGEAILVQVNLGGASFAGARLEEADFSGSTFGDVDLRGADLSRVTFLECSLAGARLALANLEGATFIKCTLDGADLSEARVSKTSFVTSTGEDVSLQRARGRQMVFAEKCAFNGLDLRDAALPELCARGAALRGARLDRADLSDADLSECDLSGGSLQRTRLPRAQLIRVCLDQASLLGADLREALLSKARLRGADFRGANLHQADLSRVLGDERTRFTEAEVGHVRMLPKAKGEEVSS